ncbi:hypothetical protein F2P56_033088 [Juglans regia]|uniref:Endonuclease/exonuclease/phosphatase domain-containing protein n=1 Tax=Juglans regia TaxID=51240 RepID=A0A833U730_JUGRE|nr:hypothetical protein F2P56_033088 [Juglans regia]
MVLLVAIEVGHSMAMKSTVRNERELKRLQCPINYDNKEGTLRRDRLKGRDFTFVNEPKIFSWNVRGINDINKRLRIRSLIHSWKIDFVCLQETKLDFVDRSIICSLWRGSFVGWTYLASSGASGGVLVMLDSRVLEMVEDCISVFSVAYVLRNLEDGWTWALASVYGPNRDWDRYLLWDEVSVFYSLWDLPCCICGDFNIIRFPSEGGFIFYDYSYGGFFSAGFWLGTAGFATGGG